MTDTPSIFGERLRRDFALISTLRGFFERDAFFLFKTLRDINFQPSQPALEIGVFCGRSLTALATLYPDVAVHGVDPFYADFAASPAFTDEAELLRDKSAGQSPEARIAAIGAVLELLDRANGTSLTANVRLHRQTEAEFYATDPGRFQLIHIDADHSFAAVTASLDILPKTLLPGGWLVLDDFLNPGFPDISEAVHTHRLFRAGLWPVVYAANKAVFVSGETETAAQALRAAVASRFVDAGASVRRMHDGAPMAELPALARPQKRAKTLGQRLCRLFGAKP